MVFQHWFADAVIESGYFALRIGALVEFVQVRERDSAVILALACSLRME
jgi:hypothetical protein